MENGNVDIAREAFDLTRQQRWEVEGTTRAARLYEEAAAVADPTTLPSGKRLLREVVPALSARIVQAQEEGLQQTTRRGRASPWAAPVQLLDAPTLALITACGGLRLTHGLEGEADARIASFARGLATDVRVELDYRSWVAEQKKANKAALKVGDREHRNLLAAFQKVYPNPDTRVWRMWQRKMEMVRGEPWTPRVAIQFGAALARWLVEAVPSVFSIETVHIQGQRKLYLRLSEETRLMMHDIETRRAVCRPRLMPMLVPPNPWEYPTTN